jgi:hypothetical protein
MQRLILAPGEPAAESESTATIAPVAIGTFLSVTYNWSYEGEPQEGILLVGCDAEDQAPPGGGEATAITAV